MKQGRGDDYILVTLTSSNSGWHKGWFSYGTTPSSRFRRSPGLHRRVAEELVGRPCEGGAGENPQESLGRAVASPRSRSHPGGSDRAVSRPRCHAAPEATASPLRDDGRSAPLDGDRDRAAAPVAARGPAPRGAGDREVDLLVAAVAAAPDAPQRRDRKNCELKFPRCALLAFVVMSVFSELVFPD
jgi:hypothetical protein